jgi:hypothetical protein
MIRKWNFESLFAFLPLSAHTSADQFCGVSNAERNEAARAGAFSRGNRSASAGSYGPHVVGPAEASRLDTREKEKPPNAEVLNSFSPGQSPL